MPATGEHGSSLPVAMVTGGAGEIGGAICRELARQSYRVIACDRRADDLRELSRGIGESCEPVPFDLTDAAACAGVIAGITARHARLDALINNAGAWHFERFVDSTDAHWGEVLHVNVIAAARLSRLAVPRLRNSARARIVMVGSKNGVRGEPGLASYNVSKAALAALARSLAGELAEDGILVNCIAPGVIETRSNSDVLDNAAATARFLKRIPLARFGQASEVAQAVAFLCSEECSFATGATFVMDGGQLASEAA